MPISLHGLHKGIPGWHIPRPSDKGQLNDYLFSSSLGQTVPLGFEWRILLIKRSRVGGITVFVGCSEHGVVLEQHNHNLKIVCSTWYGVPGYGRVCLYAVWIHYVVSLDSLCSVTCGLKNQTSKQTVCCVYIWYAVPIYGMLCLHMVCCVCIYVASKLTVHTITHAWQIILLDS